MDHLPNTVSMLAQRIRCWPAIETALGAFSVGYCRIATQQSQDVKAMLIYIKTILIESIVSAGYAGDACIPSRQKSHYPDNTIHWSSADKKLGYCL